MHRKPLGETLNVGTLYNAHVGVRVWLPARREKIRT